MRNDKTTKIPKFFSKEEGLRRAAEFRKAAEIFRRTSNFEIAEDCLDNACLEEALAERGPIGNLLVRNDVRA